MSSCEKACRVNRGTIPDGVHWEHAQAYIACSRVHAGLVMKVKYALRVGGERNILLSSTPGASITLVAKSATRLSKHCKGGVFAGKAGYVHDIFH